MADPRRAWKAQDALFIDDSVRHVESAAEICEVLRVQGNGLSLLELDALEAIAVQGQRSAPGWQLQHDEAVAAVKQKAFVPGAWYVVPS
eukprot:symbB.v1.2.003336.t1/scaffold172.1/size290804/2